PDRDHALRLEVAERVRPGWRTDRLRGLREHVVREAIAGMMERPVAGGIHRLERQADAEPHDSAAPLDADDLRRHPHPRGSLADDLDMGLRPVWIRVDAPAHVQPLDDHRAAEFLRVRRPVDEDARLVLGGRARRGGPQAIVSKRARARVCARRSRDEVLLLLVADLRQVGSRGGPDEGAGGARDRALGGRARHLCTRRFGNDEGEDYDGKTREADGHGTSWVASIARNRPIVKATGPLIPRSGEDTLTGPRVPASCRQSGPRPRWVAT